MPDPLELLAFFAALTTRPAVRHCGRGRAAAQPRGAGQARGDARPPVRRTLHARARDRLAARGVRGGGCRVLAARGARLEESIGAMRALWADSPATFEGEFTSFRAVHSEPHPINGTVPIVLGGQHRRGGDARGTRGRRLVPVRDQRRGVRPAGRRVPRRRPSTPGATLPRSRCGPGASTRPGSTSSTGCAATSTPARRRWPSASRSVPPPTSPESPTSSRATATRCSQL